MDSTQHGAIELLTPQARKVFEVVRRHSDERLTYATIVKEAQVPLITARRALAQIRENAAALGVIPLRLYDDAGRFTGLGWQMSTLMSTPDGYAVLSGMSTPDEKGDCAHEHPRARLATTTTSTPLLLNEEEGLSALHQDDSHAGERSSLLPGGSPSSPPEVPTPAPLTTPSAPLEDAEAEFVAEFREGHGRDPRPDEHPEVRSVWDYQRATEQLRFRMSTPW